MNKNFIAKIEGHGNLTVDWDKDKVKLNIFEGERLFEGILVGRTAEEMHWITSRICGVCPTAHNIASLRAVEDALDIKISETTRQLRDLMICGQMIQSHSLHLFFLSLPDYLGIDRGTELAQKNPSAFKKALALKEVSDEIVQTVGGRNVHPTTTAIGGFHQVPTKVQLKKLLKKLAETTSAAQDTVELCLGLDYPELKVDLKLAAIVNGVNDKIALVSSNNIGGRMESPVKNYKKDIEEDVRDYSTAKFGRYKGEEMLVGSLARLAVYSDHSYDDKLDFANPFYNNPAQAIEIKIYHHNALKLVQKLLENDLNPSPAQPGKNASLIGIGAVEAPRGGLYHEVHLDKDNIIIEANIITPTVQNLTSIETSAQALLKQYNGRSRQELERLLNMLVRAYDPCITCSVH